MKQWSCSYVGDIGTYLGPVELEIDGEYHHFEVYDTPYRIVFGGFTNVGFMESGYMEKDECFSLDENLQQCIELIGEFYTNGKDYSNTELFLTERM